MRTINQLRYNRSNRNGTKIKYIVIHDTANTKKGANAIAHYKYFNSGNRSSSADFFVDDTQVLCVNDYSKYYTWHCGDGKGKYGITNDNSIGIELCVNSDSNRQIVIDKAVSLVRELISELNISIDNVVRHYDASRKNCPASMSKNNWEEWHNFKKRLQNSEKTDDCVVYDYVDENMPEYARPTIQKLLDIGALKGESNGRLNLTNDMLRILVILDRANAF